MSSTHSLLYAFLLVAIAGFVVRKRRAGGPLPPGPRPLPFIGNVFDLPKDEIAETFSKWKEQYGDVVYLQAFGTSYVILNTSEAVSTLLEKRSSKYSHRPTLVLLGKLMGLGRSMALFDSDENFRLHRRLTNLALGAGGVKRYHEMQERTAILLAQNLLSDPQDFAAQFRLSAGRIVVATTYGYEVDSAKHPFIAEADKTLGIIADCLAPGAAFLDFFPSLQYLPSWLPFCGFKKYAAEGRKQIEGFVSAPFDQVQRDIAQGTAPPSYTQDLLAEHESAGESAEEQAAFAETVKWSGGTMYGAGAETTYLSMNMFVMLMALHPSIQDKARAEVLSVTRDERLPVMSDRPSMPYVEAVICEILRWHVALPFSIPRRTAEADEYNGHYIPKGTIVLPNVWSIARENIPDPDEFRPERYLNQPEPQFVFGFGRRLCPGRYLAMNSLFIMMSTMLAVFEIRKAVDGAKQEVPIVPKYKNGLISFPEAFQATIVPRSVATAEMVKDASLARLAPTSPI